MKEYAGHRKYDSLLVKLLHQIASYKLREELLEYFCNELFKISSCDMMIVIESYKTNIKDIDDIEVFKLLDRNPNRNILSNIKNGDFIKKVNYHNNIFSALSEAVVDRDVITYHSTSKMIDFAKYLMPISSFRNGGWLSFVYLPRPTPKHAERFLLLWYDGTDVSKIPATLTQDERVLYLFSHYYELASFNIKNKAKTIYQQRMEMLKALVPSMISHEIYHKTVTIGTASNIILEENQKILDAKTLKEAKEMSEELKQTILKAMMPSINSLNAITSSISKLTKQVEPEDVNIKQMLEESILVMNTISSKLGIYQVIEESILLMNTIASRLGIYIRLFSPDIHIRTDRALAMHLVMNLISNSIDAYEGMDIDDKLIDIRVDSSDEENIDIYVSDYAKGIPKEIEKRLFDEGFSTKTDGNGLGLSICSYISGFLGGSISLVDYKKYTTTFKVSLPRDSFKMTTLKEEIN